MIVTYYPHSKNIHNLKVIEFEILEIQSMFQNFKNPLSHVNEV
jgi:hypothetical protein